MNHSGATSDPQYEFAEIAYHDSWISVDPIIGCQMDCQYCFMQIAGWTRMRPSRLRSVPEIVDMLLGHKYFVPHRTPISFGNQTDPFHPANVADTLQFLQVLDNAQLRNPVALATKKLIPQRFLDEVETLKHIRPVFCISYSELPRSVERGVDVEDARSNFRTLSAREARVIHFWRPLLEENGRGEVLERVLEFVAPLSMASVYVGLKLNPALNRQYARNPYLSIPSRLMDCFGDYIPEGVEERLRALARNRFPKYPLYKHTSCAVSLTLGEPDYNATVYDDTICGNSVCPPSKRQICEEARSVPSERSVRMLLERISTECEFAITQDSLKLKGAICQEDFAFLLHQIAFPISAVELNCTRVLRGSIFRKNHQTQELPKEGTANETRCDRE